MDSRLEKNQDVGLLMVRITVGVLILFHGVANLLSGYAAIQSILAGAGLPGFLAYGVFFGEIVAPVLIILGFRARLASTVLAFNILVAVLLAHSKDVFALNQFGGWMIELQAFYFFCAIAVFFTGAGRKSLSVDSDWD